MASPNPSAALNELWSARVLGGAPFVPLDEFPDIEADLAPGDAIDLLGSSGDKLGFGLFDPENGVVRSLPAADGEDLDESCFRRRIDAAFAMRRQVGLVRPESAYRLVHSEGDGLSGFLVDIYARYAAIYTFAEGFERYLDWIANSLESSLRPEGIIWKVRPAGETPVGRIPARQLRGSEPPARLTVVEDESRYEIHLAGGINTGLFCDMRDVRRALVPWCRGQRVLNTFSYTGSFSVVAAKAGAKAVVSVDLAAGVLHWTKTNFSLNGLNPADHKFKFVKQDVFDFLKAERRKQSHYDVVILDPPAATSMPGRRWFLKSDYDRLIAHAVRVTAPGGLLVIAANSLETRPEGIENQIRAAAKETATRLRLVQSFGLPADFPTQMIYPQHRYLKCFFTVLE